MSEVLDDWLRRRYPTAKRQTLKRMVEAGRVRVNGQVARKLRQELSADDEVRVDERAAPPPRPIIVPFPIVFEDDDLIVIDKPAGLLTSTVPREPRPTAIAHLRQYIKQRQPNARVGVIHRLDRDASGLLVFSKNDAAYRALKGQFFHHTVQRIYIAAVEGIPDPRSGRIDLNLVEHHDGHVYVAGQPDQDEPGKRGERAVTDYQTLSDNRARALVQLTLKTGRKHQIRAHLSHRGTPIVGDTMYGAPTPAPRLMLAAVRLEFDHPRTHEPLRFELPPPKEILACLREVREAGG